MLASSLYLQIDDMSGSFDFSFCCVWVCSRCLEHNVRLALAGAKLPNHLLSSTDVAHTALLLPLLEQLFVPLVDRGGLRATSIQLGQASCIVSWHKQLGVT